MVQVDAVESERNWYYYPGKLMDCFVVLEWVVSAVERIEWNGCWLSCLARVVDSLRGQHSYYLLRREGD